MRSTREHLCEIAGAALAIVVVLGCGASDISDAVGGASSDPGILDRTAQGRETDAATRSERDPPSRSSGVPSASSTSGATPSSMPSTPSAAAGHASIVDAKDAGVAATIDAGDWDCTGSHGAKLTCQSHGARTVIGSRFDPDQHCFVTPRSFDNVCAVPTYCPSGDGQLVCFVSPSGYAYGLYILYGEELTIPMWHHEQAQQFESTLNSAEQTLCTEFWKTYQGVKDLSGAGRDDPSALLSPKNVAIVPTCPDDGTDIRL